MEDAIAARPGATKTSVEAMPASSLSAVPPRRMAVDVVAFPHSLFSPAAAVVTGQKDGVDGNVEHL